MVAILWYPPNTASNYYSSGTEVVFDCAYSTNSDTWYFTRSFSITEEEWKDMLSAALWMDHRLESIQGVLSLREPKKLSSQNYLKDFNFRARNRTIQRSLSRVGKRRKHEQEVSRANYPRDP
jgi:hypothetical protein